MATGARTRILTGALLACLLATVAGGIVLQSLSGGIRLRSLSPAVLSVALGMLGALIVLRRPGLRLGPVLMINALVFGPGTLAAGLLDYGSVHQVARALAEVAFAVVWLTVSMNAAWVLFILWFPDGQFVSRSWRRFFVFAAAAIVGLVLAAWLAGPSGKVSGFYAGTSVPVGVGGPFAGTSRLFAQLANVTLLFPVLALGSILQRYRREGPVIRQQVRWLFAALAIDIVAQILSAPFVDHSGAVGSVASAIALLATPLPVLAATAAILRYRLWEIDVVVSRALVYGVLWVLLSALLLIPGLTAGLLVGGRDAFAAVVVALFLTVVFQPARSRLERLSERLVYRHRARPYVLLTEFWETLRTTDLEQLGPLVAGALRDGLGVSCAGVWLYARSGEVGTLRPLGVAGAPSGGVCAIARAAAEQLRDSGGLVLSKAPSEPLRSLLPGGPAAVVPMVAAHQLVGLLACGERRGDPLRANDFELLELFARDCALRLRNLRLEAELRERLSQIESQAVALTRSRRRIVSAQDEARRRIERNLHDGVQQQLVSLAVRLRRTAAEGDAVLTDLADEAEQAVFALQELGRGIYPAVLIDQGLGPALRAQAARMPLVVRIEVDPQLVGMRLDPELEAALYFVALEALANVQKHAPDAVAQLGLRLEHPAVVLDVADDGPGLHSQEAPGAGLHNMEDRIAATGGSFTIHTQPGAGTHIRASVPVRLSGGGRLPEVDQHRGHPSIQLGLRAQAQL